VSRSNASLPDNCLRRSRRVRRADRDSRTTPDTRAPHSGPYGLRQHVFVSIACVLGLLITGCTQQMSDQPSYGPLRPSEFFPDGRSERPPVPGTVARGRLNDDDAFFTGRDGPEPAALAPGAAAGPGAAVGKRFVDRFPFEMTEAVLKRGQQRFGIYCSMCHGLDGTGNGKIVERGFTRPPSYLTDLSRGYLRRGEKMSLRNAPVGYLFDVVTNGYGAMASYKEQIGPRDRWAIIGYVRVLQAAGAGERVAERGRP
jgi:mono/diheme cytochrome c family protein